VNGKNFAYKDNLSRIRENLVFDYRSYVLSQMHQPFACHWQQRDLYTVHRVYSWLVEDCTDISQRDILDVLHWFYKDLSDFFRAISYLSVMAGLNISITVPEDRFLSQGIGYDVVLFEDERTRVLRGVESGDGSYASFVQLAYKELKDLDSVFVDGEQLDRFVMSVILHRHASEDSYIRWREK
jgi:hypothetical protein